MFPPHPSPLGYITLLCALCTRTRDPCDFHRLSPMPPGPLFIRRCTVTKSRWLYLLGGPQPEKSHRFLLRLILCPTDGFLSTGITSLYYNRLQNIYLNCLCSTMIRERLTVYFVIATVPVAALRHIELIMFVFV